MTGDQYAQAGKKVGEAIAALVNVAVKFCVIAACGRYLGWW